MGEAFVRAERQPLLRKMMQWLPAMLRSRLEPMLRSEATVVGRHSVPGSDDDQVVEGEDEDGGDDGEENGDDD